MTFHFVSGANLGVGGEPNLTSSGGEPITGQGGEPGLMRRGGEPTVA